MLRKAECSSKLGPLEARVTFVRRSVGALDGAQSGGHPRFAGGAGLAVSSAVGTLGQGLAELFDLTDVSFALIGVSGDGEYGGVGGRGIEDEGDRLALGVSVG